MKYATFVKLEKSVLILSIALLLIGLIFFIVNIVSDEKSFVLTVVLWGIAGALGASVFFIARFGTKIFVKERIVQLAQKMENAQRILNKEASDDRKNDAR